MATVQAPSLPLQRRQGALTGRVTPQGFGEQLQSIAALNQSGQGRGGRMPPRRWSSGSRMSPCAKSQHGAPSARRCCWRVPRRSVRGIQTIGSNHQTARLPASARLHPRCRDVARIRRKRGVVAGSIFVTEFKNSTIQRSEGSLQSLAAPLLRRPTSALRSLHPVLNLALESRLCSAGFLFGDD